MDKVDLIGMLRRLDEVLTTPVDLLIVGGAAMVLHFGAQRATRDVDGWVIHGSSAEVRRAVQQVAEECGMPADWLNDGVKGFAAVLPPDFELRLEALDFGFEQLHTFALGRAEQAAMKIIALRERDLEDLELLLPGMSATERAQLISIAERAEGLRADWGQKLHYFLLEQGWKIE